MSHRAHLLTTLEAETAHIQNMNQTCHLSSVKCMPLIPFMMTFTVKQLTCEQKEDVVQYPQTHFSI